MTACLAACLPTAAWAGSAKDVTEDFLSEDDGATGAGLGWLFEGLNRVDAEWELLDGNDITVWRTAARFEQQRGDFTFGASVGYTDFDVEYRDPVQNHERDREEDSREAQVDLAWKSSSSLEWNATLRGYDGFPDYRAVWIAEYYRQLFTIGGQSLPGYKDPDPAGWAASGGVKWTVVPGVTTLSFSSGYGYDDIVPGWSSEGPTAEEGRDHLESLFGSVVWEQAVTGWLKTETSARFINVTDRDPRFQLQSNWAAALGPDWTLIANAGATREQPDFEAYYGGARVDYEFRPRWHVAVNARIYDDTGEIESSGFSTAAPSLRSYEVGASLLYDRGDFAVRLSSAFFQTDYDPVTRENAFFGDLYKDRDWWITRIAVTYSF